MSRPLQNHPKPPSPNMQTKSSIISKMKKATKQFSLIALHWKRVLPCSSISPAQQSRHGNLNALKWSFVTPKAPLGSLCWPLAPLLSLVLLLVLVWPSQLFAFFFGSFHPEAVKSTAFVCATLVLYSRTSWVYYIDLYSICIQISGTLLLDIRMPSLYSTIIYKVEAMLPYP